MRGNINSLRFKAWAFGRTHCDDLMERYRERYGVETLPPPACIIDELLTDFLDVDLRFDPLPENLYAQVEIIDGRTRVTVNKLTADIPGVVDAEGVQNVAKFHELIHVVCDVGVLRERQQFRLTGFEGPDRIVCFRQGFGRSRDQEVAQREFWAEEAGRAAAVCHASLNRSQAYTALIELRPSQQIRNDEAWRLLYQAAADIGVNRSALVTQLEAEGRISVGKEGGRQVLRVQPMLSEGLAW